MTPSVAQLNFMRLHLAIVTAWRWHFCETQLRAFEGRQSATIWRDELNELISADLMWRGQGAADVHLTDAGRQLLAEQGIRQ